MVSFMILLIPWIILLETKVAVSSSATLSATGCRCIFDPGQRIITDLYECACCNSGATQCGYPQHNKCQFDNSTDGGCRGKGPDGQLLITLLKSVFREFDLGIA